MEAGVEMPAQAMANGISKNTVIRVEKDEGTANDIYKLAIEDSSKATIFIAGDAWGEPQSVIIEGKEQQGVVVPIKYQKGQLLLTESSEEVDNTVKTNMQIMNSSLEEIKDKVGVLGDARIFIDNRNADSVSLAIMKDVVESKVGEENIVNNADDATVILTAPTFTPYSFYMSAKDFGRQVDQILQAGNEPA